MERMSSIGARQPEVMEHAYLSTLLEAALRATKTIGDRAAAAGHVRGIDLRAT